MTLDEKIAAIRAGLDGVPKGPWGVEDGANSYFFEMRIASADGGIALADDAAASHIARLDPETVRAILDALDEAQKENARLREALKPFGVWAPFGGNDPDDGNIHGPDEDLIDEYGLHYRPPSLGDLRRARAALEGK